MLFVRQEIPPKSLQVKELSWKYIYKNKFKIKEEASILLMQSFNLTLLNNHIQNRSRGLHFYLWKYDNFMVLEDFNAETSNTTISEICATYNLKNLIKEPTCSKSLENPTCVDIILTNRPQCFQKSNVFETGLSDFHKLTFTVMKAYFQKQQPKIIKYRSYKKIDNNLFRNDPLNKLLSKNVQAKHLIYLRLLLSIYLTDLSR